MYYTLIKKKLGGGGEGWKRESSSVDLTGKTDSQLE